MQIVIVEILGCRNWWSKIFSFQVLAYFPVLRSSATANGDRQLQEEGEPGPGFLAVAILGHRLRRPQANSPNFRSPPTSRLRASATVDSRH
jgi:hypothetical protein